MEEFMGSFMNSITQSVHQDKIMVYTLTGDFLDAAAEALDISVTASANDYALHLFDLNGLKSISDYAVMTIIKIFKNLIERKQKLVLTIGANNPLHEQLILTFLGEHMRLCPDLEKAEELLLSSRPCVRGL